MLLVHAHPDDETITTGATMARYAAEGVAVTLVTCTRGEQGEVIPDRLAGLRTGGDPLGDRRVRELAGAMAALGVTDHRFLGDHESPGRPAGAALAAGATVYRDSGMAYGPGGTVVAAPSPPHGAFALVDVDEPARWLADLVRRLRPQVVVTYEPGGGYGHPDHVQAHRVAMRAVELGAPDVTPAVFWSVLPASLYEEDSRARRSAAGGEPVPVPVPVPSMVVPDSEVGVAVDGTAFAAAKLAALRAHETQVAVADDGTTFALSNGIAQPVRAVEYFRRAGAEPSDRPRRDLFDDA